ncbi:MAG: glutamine--fructose-6-phosphate transaminase (isomerizing) [Bacteroidales bacterium]|jgi:glucosamine--fructose-6-phosphate aminotransferase (isomerizing)|nr:glutamine--fructose-6-phosphate transaminase (isomerizing) [Bacteroidales bacterium]
MCGIVAYIGKKQAYPILIKGLKRLEYRGYDSAGIALINDNHQLSVYKTKGKVADLEHFIKDKNISGTIGIAHTRWATHGEPNDKNAHPHFSENECLALIHNGIIENYSVLKEELMSRGRTFQSDTDTEVLVQLIDYIKVTEKTDLVRAVQLALSQVTGAYAIAILSKENPDMLIAARKGSPLVVGVGEDEFLLGSDASPIVEYTKDVVYLNDEEIVVLERGKKIKVTTLKNVKKTPRIQTLEMSLEALEKGDFPHFMLKEIFEQPKTLRDSMRGRISTDLTQVALSGIIDNKDKFMKARRILIVACGTSWHAGLIGEYIIEELTRIPVEVEYASEFRYRNPIIYKDDVVIAISQSGETADTLAAIELAKKAGAFVYGICNVVGSSIPRLTDSGTYMHAGPEIGVASTKAFTAQVTALILVGLVLAKEMKTISDERYLEIIKDLSEMPEKIEETLKLNEQIKDFSKIFTYSKNFLYLGRGYNYPLALEGALKLKEISYIHAEGYPAAEMKHGPIALIDSEMPVVVIATNKGHYDKIVSNIQEVKARKARIISIVTKGDTTVKNISDFCIEIPETEEMLVPILACIPLQLLAYHIATLKGCNVDQPRNLAKSVTVE